MGVALYSLCVPSGFSERARSKVSTSHVLLKVGALAITC